MTRTIVRSAFVFLLILAPTMASAQWVVHDPTNYAQAVTTYGQLAQQYQLLLQQTRRLPADMAARYRAPQVLWPSHVVSSEYAEPMLTALNDGDPGGLRYARAVDRLAPVHDVLSRVPTDLRRRIGTNYATIELADRLAMMAINQTAAIRANGRDVLRTIQSMEDDAVAGDDTFHTETALLNKINGASVLGLRIADRTSQFMMNMLEQLVVGNKRQRDAEAKLMNAQIHHWRYGEDYAEDLYRNTARNLDQWRQP